MKISKAVEQAWKAALKTRSHSYSPYSKFKVGAAIKVKGVEGPITGCNVENASYGATVCAERVAATRAIAEHGKKPVEFVVVVTDEAEATVPCALCLQVLAEIANDDLPIYLANEKKILKAYQLKDLLPIPFRSFEVN